MFVLSRSCGFWVKKPFWGTLLLCDESQGDDNTWQEDLAVLKPLYPILCLNSSHVKDISIMFPWQKQYLNCSLRSLIIYCLWHKIYIFIIFISSRNSYIHFFFHEGTVTNPAIWLVLSAVRIFLSLITVTVTAGNSASECSASFVNELQVIVDLFRFTLSWTINQRKFISIHF